MEKLAKQSASRVPVQPDERLFPAKGAYDLRLAFTPLASGSLPGGDFSWPSSGEKAAENKAGIWMSTPVSKRGLLWK